MRKTFLAPLAVLGLIATPALAATTPAASTGTTAPAPAKAKPAKHSAKTKAPKKMTTAKR